MLVQKVTAHFAGYRDTCEPLAAGGGGGGGGPVRALAYAFCYREIPYITSVTRGEQRVCSLSVFFAGGSRANRQAKTYESTTTCSIRCGIQTSWRAIVAILGRRVLYVHST